MKRIVLTGATGAIGVALMEECMKQNIEMLVLCRKDSAHLNRIPSSPLVKLVLCGLNEMNDFPVKKEGYDIFFHLGWDGTTGNKRNDLYLQNCNIAYTLDAVHLAKRLGCHTFIGAGSQAEYGRTEKKINEHTPVNPENGNGIAKLCSGMMSRLECKKEGIRHIWARILSVYGPCNGDDTLIISAIRMLLQGKEPQLTPGEQIWDYLYSEDAARALLLLGERGKDGEVYCLGSGIGKPLREYLYELRDVVNPKIPLGFGKRPYGEQQVMCLHADIRKLQEDTGFEPQICFSEGIRKTMEWVKRTKEEKYEKDQYNDSLL